MNPQAVIFGLDGATYTVLDDLMARGVMPYLKEFIASGTRGTLMSVKPPLTPPAWSSLVTGKMPGHHGVTGFFQYDAPDSNSIQLISSRQLVAQSIWGMVNQQGKRAGSLNFVAHQPAPKIDGWVIPGWVSWRWIKRLSHPATLVDQLKEELPGFDVKALAVDFEEERKAVAGAPIDDYRSWVDLHIRRETMLFEVKRHLQKTQPVDLIGIVYDGVDKLQHLLWTFVDPRIQPAEPTSEHTRVREMAFDYFRTIDGLLQKTVDFAGPEATTLICSDHGFTYSYEVLYINKWLEDKGYLVWKTDHADAAEDSLELEPSFYQLGSFDMEKTRAYALTTSSNGIYIPVKGKKGNTGGVDPADYEAFRAKLAEELLKEVVDPATGEPIITEVKTRDEIFDGPKKELAPDLTLALRDFGFVSVRRNKNLLVKRPMYLGTHHPEGIIIGRGPGIKSGYTLAKPAHLIDVAPTTLYAMDLEIPEDLQGKLIEDMYEPEFLTARKPKLGGQAVVAAETVSAEEPQEDEDIFEKLKALGYIE